MIGICYSGTGNTRFAAEKFLQCFHPNTRICDLLDPTTEKALQEEKDILLAYPTYFSALPKAVEGFILQNAEVWKDKNVFILATYGGPFIGDATGVAARVLVKHGAKVTGGLQLNMPDNICDIKLYCPSDSKAQRLIKHAEEKIECVAEKIKSNGKVRQGLSPWSRVLGGFLRLVSKKEQADLVKINPDLCNHCGKCVDRCKAHNLYFKEGKIVPNNECIMCYRCANECPVQAITILGKEVAQQYDLDRFTKM